METTTQQERLCGIIRTWHQDRGFGVILQTHRRLFFCHIREFDAPREPRVGERVTFLHGPLRREGELPAALDVRLCTPDAPASLPDTLSELPPAMAYAGGAR